MTKRPTAVSVTWIHSYPVEFSLRSRFAFALLSAFPTHNGLQELAPGASFSRIRAGNGTESALAVAPIGFLLRMFGVSRVTDPEGSARSAISVVAAESYQPAVPDDAELNPRAPAWNPWMMTALAGCERQSRNTLLRHRRGTL
jgi:hypothetical protein